MLGDLRTRVRLFIAVASAVVLVQGLLWRVVKPGVWHDPVSLIYNNHLLLSWLLLVAVAGSCALLTVVICRGRLPDLPVLVLASGLSVLSVRSGAAVRAHWTRGAQVSYISFALELLLLTAALYGVHILGKLFLVWMGGRRGAEHHPAREFSLAPALQGLGLAVLAAGVAAFLVGTTIRTVVPGAEVYTVYASERGQIIFAALAAGFLSCLAAHQALRPAKSLFCWLGLPLVGIAAFLGLAAWGLPAGESLALNPLGNFLPLDFVGPGVLGGMLGLLLSHKLFRNRAAEEA